MAEPTYTVRALDESTWTAFAALAERNSGIFGGCWCMGFHDDDSRTDPGHNRSAKERRVRDGHAHAALVYEGDDCVGWCQFGAPDEVPRIKSRAAYEKGRTTSPDWRIACCYVGKGHRRQGVATAALAGALDLIAGLRKTSRTAAQGGPAGVAVDGSHLYWANYGAGTINEAPLAGGTATTLVTGLNSPYGVAVYGNHIYWTNLFAGTIDEANLNGTDVTTLVSGQGGPQFVAVSPS